MEDQSSRNHEFMAINQLPLKKMIPQLLLSLSVFSLVVSYSSLLAHSPKFHHSYHLVSQALMNKNCLFLICNGLLVFLAKSSGLVHPPYGYYEDDVLLHKRFIAGHGLQQPAFEENKELNNSIQDKEKEEKEEEEKEGEEAVENERPCKDLLVVDIADSEEDERDDTNECGRSWIFFGDEGVGHGEQVIVGKEDDREGEDEDEDEEELNKRIEEFIRRMKEEILVNEAPSCSAEAIET